MNSHKRKKRNSDAREGQSRSKDEIFNRFGDLICSFSDFSVVLFFEEEGGFLVNARLRGSSTIINKFVKVLKQPLENFSYDLTEGSHVFAECYKRKKPIFTTRIDWFLVNPHTPQGQSVLIGGRKLSQVTGNKYLAAIPSYHEGVLYSIFMVAKKTRFNKSDKEFLLNVAHLLGNNLAMVNLIDGMKKKSDAVKELFSFSSKVVDVGSQGLSSKKEVENVMNVLLGSDDKVSKTRNPSTARRGLEVDFNTGEIYSNGMRMKGVLSAKEMDLLVYMLENRYKVTTREDVARILWEEGASESYSDWAISQKMYRIRKKLQDKQPYSHLITLKGRGFMLRGVRSYKRSG